MPTYLYRCGTCDDDTEIIVPIGTARRMLTCRCGGTARLRIGAGVNIAPSALENKGTEVRASNDREDRWSKDMPAYKRMRHRGMQPSQIDGSASLEDKCDTQFDVHYRKMLDEGIPRQRLQESAEQAREIMEDAGADWKGIPVK